MPKLPKAFSVLTKKELKHLKEDAGVTTLSGFKRTAEAQAEMRKTMVCEPCWDCRHIAMILGLPV